MRNVNIGIIGFGTVGAGVVECILKNGEMIAERTGLLPVITGARCFLFTGVLYSAWAVSW